MAGIIKGLVSDGTLPSTAKSNLAADIGNPASTIRTALNTAGLGKGASDADIAAFVGNKTTATGSALSTQFAATRPAAPTEADAVKLALNGSPLTVSLIGHSQVYGQDTSVTGTLPTMHGAPQTRSATPPPETLQAIMDKMWGPGIVTVKNLGYPGDTTTKMLDRWKDEPLGQLVVMWCDSNDESSGIPMSETRENTQAFIERALAEGCQPVIIGGHHVNTSAASWGRQSRAQIMQRIAGRYGVPYFDVQELLNRTTTGDLWTDGVHLRPQAFAEIGTRLAALLAPKAASPFRAAPGAFLHPRHNRILGAGVGVAYPLATSLTNSAARITAGETIVIPVDAVAPTRPRFSFHSAGVGTGRIRYAQGLSVAADIPVNIHGGGAGISVHGHQLQGGIDIIELVCDSGQLDVEYITFDQPVTRLQKWNTAARLTTSAEMTGLSMGRNLARLDAGWEFFGDQSTTVSTVNADGTPREAFFEFDMTFGPSAGDFYGSGTVMAASAISLSSSHQVRDGFGIRRNGDDLVVRQWTSGTGSNVETVTAYFPAGAEWRGRGGIHFQADGMLQLYVNGAKVGAAVARPPYNHYFPAVLTGTTPVTIHGVTVRGTWAE